MTVLTLPTTGLKSDKVPLVDHDAAAAECSSSSSPPPPPPPPYVDDPKLLECGGLRGHGTPSLRALRYRLHTLRAIRMTMMVLACAVVVLISCDALCKSYGPNNFCKAYDHTASAVGFGSTAPHVRVNRRDGRDDDDDNDDENGDDDDDDDAATAARVPCKSYTSYAAAEDDMLSRAPSSAVVSSSSDYDAGQFSGMEDVYKKLEKFALNRALANDDGDGDDDGDDGDGVVDHHRKRNGDVVSVFKEDVQISGGGGGGLAIPQQPPAVVTKSARFIHDFSVNVTGIVDVDGRRCFVMPLVRDAVSPPASLFDLLFKMSSGYYSMDITKVMAGMRVVKPALDDLSAYGLYISKDCADYSTFKLEKAVSVPADV